MDGRLIQIRANLLGVLHWREAYPGRYLPCVYKRNILSVVPTVEELNAILQHDDFRYENISYLGGNMFKKDVRALINEAKRKESWK